MSSLFVQTPCRLPPDSLYKAVAWSSCDSFFAVSFTQIETDYADRDIETFQVMLVNNEGGMMNQSSISHPCPCTCLAWQPRGRLLAIGWADGTVSCWQADGKSRPLSTASNTSQHNSSISVLKWNPTGKRLITGDNDGTVNVWAVDAKGSLTPSRQYKKRGVITTAVFCTHLMAATKTASGAAAASDQVKKANPADWKNSKNYSPSFFFGTERGSVVYADDLGHCTEVQQLSSAIDKMLFYEERGRLVIITRSLLLTQYQVADDGRVSRVMQVKLSVAKEVADQGIRSVVWAGPGLLALATHEKMVRLIDLSTDESYNLSLSQLGTAVDKTDRVINVSFNPIKRCLAVGTLMGTVAIWKYDSKVRNKESGNSASVVASDWVLFHHCKVEYPVRDMSWSLCLASEAAPNLSVMTEQSLDLLSENIMWGVVCGELAVVQVSPTELSVQVDQRDSWVEDMGLQIRGLAVSRSSLVVWSGKQARVAKVDVALRRAALLEPFTCTAMGLAIADSRHITEDAVFIADGNAIRITNCSGTQKGTINFSDIEGNPTHIDVNGKFLFVMTSNLMIKIFDVYKPTNPKPVGTAAKFSPNSSATSLSSQLEVRQIKGSATGSRIAILCHRVDGAASICNPDTCLYIYDRSKGAVMSYDFAPLSRYPNSAFWDNFDDRLLVCDAIKLQMSSAPSGGGGVGAVIGKQLGGADSSSETSQVHETVLLFASTEHGVLLQDSFSPGAQFGTLMGVDVPNIIFRQQSASQAPQAQITNVTFLTSVMRDFVGLTRIDDEIKSALLDFSFNLTLGKLDEAYRAVKAIDSPIIWENMAHMCVKTKRLDVAEVCLGHMGHARGAAALRESLALHNPSPPSEEARQNQIDVSVGVLAVQLGLLDDAARLFREAGKYNMLCELYQAAGLWDKALLVAQQHDRLHLRTTYFHYAQHLESIGQLEEATVNYENSQTFRTEVPRMFFTLNQIDELENYVQQSNDAILLKWWAAYLESKDRFDKARKYYAKAGDFLSLVRILCFQGEFNKAADIVAESGNSAAAYHFARQLEARGDLQEAISYYASSGCFNHAIRLAKAYSMDSELMRFAIKSTPSLMFDCAYYFEMKGDYEKAVELYHKGGDYPRALDLCFRLGGDSSGSNSKTKLSSQLFDMLNTIAQDLGANTSPQTLARCAEFLVAHKQFDKAIELYVMAQRYNNAIEMCAQHKVNLTDEMVDMLTPPATFESTERKELLCDIARALKKQGSFILANKKYTQAGEFIKAMKCLVRAGDTKSVIQFASICRKPDVYKLAANYLQQMDWREAEIMKSIISFYTKAKAFEQLSGFYDSCAQVEIDEYRDYEKAHKALRESLRYLSEAKGAHIEEMVSSMDVRLSIIEQFIEARKFVKSNPRDMVIICEKLLNEPHLDLAIRVGDCLAMLVEYFHSIKDFKRAYHYMLDMKERRILLHPYIDSSVLDQVHRAVGAQLDPEHEQDEVSSPRQGDRQMFFNNGDVDGDDVDEDIVDEELEEDEEEEKKFSSKSGNNNKNSNSFNGNKRK